MLLPHPELSCDRRCAGAFSPSAGCSVATKEVRREVELAIRSFQEHHSNAPVLVVCDEETQAYLNHRNFEGQVFAQTLNLVDPSIVKHNTYHRADAILWKMEALNLAVQRFGDAVFFDADIIFLKPLSGPDDCEIALSHNLACLPAEKEGATHGIFNAGLVWTCNLKFANWWKAIYLRNEGFYEQAGLNMAPRVFRTSYFDIKHNFGFWRGPLLKRFIGSAHCHLDTTIDKTMPAFMQTSLYNFRREVWKRIYHTNPNLCKKAREIFEHPRKLFFIHYGKAGGIYTNELMNRQIVSDYKFFDSWKMGLSRDWQQHELHEILTSSEDDCRYLHQHHIHVQQKDIDLARARGWTTFTFLRDPKELICSLFFWRKNQIKEIGQDTLFRGEDPSKEYTMQEFWSRVVKEMPELWCLPDYIHDVDEVSLFSDANFTKLLIKWFGYSHSLIERMNVSGNPGLAKCIETGSVTQQMTLDLELTPQYQAFEEFTTSL